MLQLPEPERHLCCPNFGPSIMTLVMTATVLSWMPWEEAGADGRGEAQEAGPDPQQPPRPGTPQALNELRRQLLEHGQHRRVNPRQPAESANPEGTRVLTGRSSGTGSPAAVSVAPSATFFSLSSGSSPGLWSYSLTNVLTIPHAVPVRAPVSSPLTFPLVEALSEPSPRLPGGPLQQERRPAPVRGAEQRLSDHERALLRQQLREIVRPPAARQNR